MYFCAAASLAAFLCPQDFPFVLIIRGTLYLMAVAGKLLSKETKYSLLQQSPLLLKSLVPTLLRYERPYSLELELDLLVQIFLLESIQTYETLYLNLSKSRIDQTTLE
jgi:hypothetical protein